MRGTKVSTDQMKIRHHPASQWKRALWLSLILVIGVPRDTPALVTKRPRYTEALDQPIGTPTRALCTAALISMAAWTWIMDWAQHNPGAEKRALPMQIHAPLKRLNFGTYPMTDGIGYSVIGSNLGSLNVIETIQDGASQIQVLKNSGPLLSQIRHDGGRIPRQVIILDHLGQPLGFLSVKLSVNSFHESLRSLFPDFFRPSSVSAVYSIHNSAGELIAASNELIYASRPFSLRLPNGQVVATLDGNFTTQNEWTLKIYSTHDIDERVLALFPIFFARTSR